MAVWGEIRPSLTPVSRFGARADAATVLTSFLTLLFVVPATEVVGALGSAGHPATIVSIGAMAWWLWHRIQTGDPAGLIRRPVRTATLVFLLVMLLVYAHAMTRVLPPDEVSPADSGLLRILGAGGVVLIAVDGLGTADRLWVLARRFAAGGGLIALLAIAQYVTNRTWVELLAIPGLTPPSVLGLQERGGLIRPSATATNPIEFAMVLSLALPIAIAVARNGGRRRRTLRWGVVVTIGIGLLLSISRTAIIGSVVGFLVLVPIWNARTRLIAAASAVGVLGATYFLVPGLAGTLAGLFSTASNDPSVQSRTGSYGIAARFIAENTWLGRGYGTFLPKYWILDNLYLQFLIEAGILGVVALLALVVTAIASSRAVSVDRRVVIADRELARGCMAAVAAGAVQLALFDAFSFPESAGCFFLVVGLCGACRRLFGPHQQRAGDQETAHA